MTKPKPEGQLLDHNYDGIQELDNPLPRWWVQLFYITIIFALGYIYYFHFGPGQSIQETFASDMAKIEAKNASTNTPLTIPTGAQWIQKGQPIYAEKCASCHAADGGGLIGPNLTDSSWINGKGTLEDIYKVIDKGVPEKGMLAWGTLMSNDDIAAAANYVLSLKGKPTASPKAPEGKSVN